MRSLRLSALLEHEGHLPVDEAVALAWKLLAEVPLRGEPRLVSPIGVLLRADGSIGVVSPLSQRVRLAEATEAERERCGRLSAWLPDEHGQEVRWFTDAARFNFGVMAVLFTCLTGQRPFDEAPPPGAPGAPVFAELVRRMGSAVPAPLARLLRTELLWHLEPAPGGRHWLRKPLSREAVISTLLSFVGDTGPAESLAMLGLRVEGALAKQPPLSVAGLTTAVQAGDEPSRQVLADAHEERGQHDEAEWLRLESRVQRASRPEAAPLLGRLPGSSPRSPARPSMGARCASGSSARADGKSSSARRLRSAGTARCVTRLSSSSCPSRPHVKREEPVGVWRLLPQRTPPTTRRSSRWECRCSPSSNSQKCERYER